MDLQELRNLCAEYWNPLGVPMANGTHNFLPHNTLPEDEYDQYLLHVADLIESDAADGELLEYLELVEKKYIMMPNPAGDKGAFIVEEYGDGSYIRLFCIYNSYDCSTRASCQGRGRRWSGPGGWNSTPITLLNLPPYSRTNRPWSAGRSAGTCVWSRAGQPTCRAGRRLWRSGRGPRPPGGFHRARPRGRG